MSRKNVNLKMNYADILDRIKSIEGVDTDSKVAELLELTPQNLINKNPKAHFTGIYFFMQLTLK